VQVIIITGKVKVCLSSTKGKLGVPEYIYSANRQNNDLTASNFNVGYIKKIKLKNKEFIKYGKK